MIGRMGSRKLTFDGNGDGRRTYRNLELFIDRDGDGGFIVI